MEAATDWNVVGHASAVGQLKAAIAARRIGHAYLISGPEGVGKTTLALEFSRALLCLDRDDGIACGVCNSCRRISGIREERTHPDLTVADVEWQSMLLGSRSGGARQQLSIEAIRWLRQDIVSRPILSSWKIQIIDDADRLSHAAPEAFLKTLEEPPASAVIILVATSAESLSETVRSRCQQVSLGFVSNSAIEQALEQRGITGRQSTRIVSIARGRAAVALKLIDQPEALDQWAVEADEAFGYISEPLGRLRLAGPIATNHTKNRDRTFSVLGHCMGLWRDALLLRSGIEDSLAYPDIRDRVAQFSSQYTTAEIARALRATRRAAHDLDRNFQARITMMAMIHAWPDPPG